MVSVLKKDAFCLCKAAWNREEKFVHLCGSRYVDRAEDETEIRVCSNQPEVTLLMDGREVGTLKGETVFVFRVGITGEHTITAAAGDARDTMTIRRAAEPDPSCRLEKTGGVANRFDEAGFKTDCFSVRDSFGALMAHPEAGKIVGGLMQKIIAGRGDVAGSANNNANLRKMMAAMSFEALLKKAGDAVPPELAKEINDRLQKIPKC